MNEPQRRSKLLFDEATSKGYRVDRLGTVFGVRGHSLSLNCRGGYYRFSISSGGVRRAIVVHRFVGYLKFGDAIFTHGIEVRHLNGNSRDNAWKNIAIGTHQQNMMDKPKAMRDRCAAAATAAIRRSDWSEIESDRREGMTYRQLESKYRVGRGALSYHFNLATVKEQMSRDDSIRNCDLLTPSQALYQAELHPDSETSRDAYTPSSGARVV